MWYPSRALLRALSCTFQRLDRGRGRIEWEYIALLKICPLNLAIRYLPSNESMCVHFSSLIPSLSLSMQLAFLFLPLLVWGSEHDTCTFEGVSLPIDHWDVPLHPDLDDGEVSWEKWHRLSLASPLPFKARPFSIATAAKFLSRMYMRQRKVFLSKTSHMYRYWQPRESLEAHSRMTIGTQGWTLTHENSQGVESPLPCSSYRGVYVMASSEISDRKFQRFVSKLVPGLNPTTHEFTMYGGCNQSGTSLHFDREHNNFLQLRGTRKFYLLPPRFLPLLHIAPVHHPHHRQSLLEDEETVLVNTSSSSRNGWVVELVPGETLFIPPFFLHKVVSTSDDSLGIALNLPTQDLIMDHLIQLPLPFEQTWTYATKYVAVAQYIRATLGSTWLLAEFMYRWRASVRPAHRFSMQEEQVQPINMTKIHHYAQVLNQTLTRLVTQSTTPQSDTYLKLEYADHVVHSMFPASAQAVDFAVNIFPKLQTWKPGKTWSLIHQSGEDFFP